MSASSRDGSATGATHVALPSQDDVKAAGAAGGMANPHRMRRIVAEDPQWNKPEVDHLRNLTVDNIVANFEKNPMLEKLPADVRAEVLNRIPVDLPLGFAVNVIPAEAESYWKRRCNAEMPLVRPRKQSTWKQIYLERTLAGCIETWAPDDEDAAAKANELIDLCKGSVTVLELEQLLPPKSGEPEIAATQELSVDAQDQPDKEDDDEDEEMAARDDKPSDHIDLSAVCEKLTELEELSVCYKVKDCGMSFRWSMYGMTSGDADLLGDCVKYGANLRRLSVPESIMDCRRARILARKMLDNKVLQELSLCNNVIGDRGGRALAKVINGHSVITSLDLTDNQIGPVGARALGESLKTNSCALVSLSLRLNKIGDLGASAIFSSLCSNTTLRTLNVSSNRITGASVKPLSDMLKKNSTLVELDLSCNELGPNAGKALVEALDKNQTICMLDTRLTKLDKDADARILDIVRSNAQGKS